MASSVTSYNVSGICYFHCLADRMMGNCFHSQTVHEASNWALGPTFYPSKVLLSPPFALLEDRFCVISRSDLSVAASADQKRAEFRTGRSKPLAYSLAPGLSVVFSRHLSSWQTCHRPPPTEAPRCRPRLLTHVQGAAVASVGEEHTSRECGAR